MNPSFYSANVFRQMILAPDKNGQCSIKVNDGLKI